MKDKNILKVAALADDFTDEISIYNMKIICLKHFNL
jgi:hypothetical protein